MGLACAWNSAPAVPRRALARTRASAEQGSLAGLVSRGDRGAGGPSVGLRPARSRSERASRQLPGRTSGSRVTIRERSKSQSGTARTPGARSPELALSLRRRKDRPRFARLHDRGLGELGFAGAEFPAGITCPPGPIDQSGATRQFRRPNFSAGEIAVTTKYLATDEFAKHLGIQAASIPFWYGVYEALINFLSFFDQWIRAALGH